MPAHLYNHPFLRANDQMACDKLIQEGSKSFYVASKLLPYDIRIASRALYAFCRVSDDLVDNENQDKTASFKLTKRLDKIYAGSPYDLISDRAFAAVVQRYKLPRTLPQALIEGFEWDEAERKYQTLNDLMDYAARVASTVGIMMAKIMGCSDVHSLARAADLGLAMQLTNIARDVGEDARNGRVYLPDELLEQHGLKRKHILENPKPSDALSQAIITLLSIADLHYRRAMGGIKALPVTCRPAIKAAALIYKDIGKQILRNNADTITKRAYTRTSRKLTLLARASLLPDPFNLVSTAPPHQSVKFLVDAASTSNSRPIKTIDDKAGRMLELMAKAAQHQRNTFPANETL